MFISKEEIKAHTGVDVSGEALGLAHMMIEAWIGRTESDVVDGSDIALLGRATMFQAVYIKDSLDVILEQAAIKSITLSESTTAFDLSMFAPYMSPWAVVSCRNLSWLGTRSVHTGPSMLPRRARPSWERD